MWAGRRKMAHRTLNVMLRNLAFSDVYTRKAFYSIWVQHPGGMIGNLLRSLLGRIYVSQHESLRICYLGLIYPLPLTMVL